MLDKYFIYVRDRNLAIKEIVDAFHSLTFVMRYNKLGSWELTLDFDNAAAQAFLAAFGEVDGSQNPINKGRTGILIYRNGTLIFSGPIRNLRERWSRQNGHTLTVGGPCDLTFLAERDVVVPPYGFQTQYSSDFFYATNASTEYCIKQVVSTQAGSSASTDRQVAGLTVLTNQNRGYSPTNLKARFTNALAEIQRAALTSENRGLPLGFYLRQNGAALEFDCYTPPDKTNKIIFGPEIGNVAEYEYSLQAPTANLVLAGDSGTGTARKFAFAGDEPSRGLWGGIENFVDGGSATTAELVDKVYESLEEGAEQNGLTFRSLELPGFSFQTDWNLGDKVKFRLRGKDTTDIMREVEIQLGPDGETITPTIGNTLGKRLQVFDHVKKMEYRLRNRENY